MRKTIVGSLIGLILTGSPMSVWAAEGDFFTGSAHLRIGGKWGSPYYIPTIWHSSHTGSKYGLQFTSTETRIAGVSSVRLRTNNSERVYFGADGKIGIGTTFPLETLDVWSRARISSLIDTGGDAYPEGIWYHGRIFGGTKDRAHGNPSGQQWGLWINDAWRFWFQGNGQAFKYGSASWAVLLDARSKKAIQDFNPGLKAVEELESIWYQPEKPAESVTEERVVAGFSPKGLQKAAPFAIQSDGSSKGKAVDVDVVNYMLINAVQELASDHEMILRKLCAKHLDRAECKK